MVRELASLNKKRELTKKKKSLSIPFQDPVRVEKERRLGGLFRARDDVVHATVATDRKGYCPGEMPPVAKYTCHSGTLTWLASI